jgi:LTXXQ motif family protein
MLANGVQVSSPKEYPMSKIFAAGLSAFLITASSLAYAQVSTGPAQGSGPAQAGPAQERLSDAEFKTLTDRRIELVKFALQLTPDQAKYWPPVEEAIRARGMARRQRLVNLVARATGQREFNPVELLRDRADALATRATNLKKLADAWQPLYASLDDNQKARMRLLAVYVLREMRDAMESRRLQSEDEYYDDSEE